MLPTRAEVDAMLQANTAYKNVVMANIEAKVSSFNEGDFSAVQWGRIQEAKQNALSNLNMARNAEETDNINETFLAEVQLVVEDASKLAFYRADISAKLQEVSVGSEVEKILQEALTVIQTADSAKECEDIYLTAVQALEGNGSNEFIPGEELEDGGDFEQVDDIKDDANSSSFGCSATLNLNGTIMILFTVVSLCLVRRKFKNEYDK